MTPSEPPRPVAPHESPVAIVIGLDSITGLQAARILADRGVPVVGLAADRRHWGAHTNACYEVMESELSGDGLLDGLHQLGERTRRAGVLVPCTDAGVDTLSRHRDRLPGHFLLPLAPHPVVELLMDKVSFAAHAADAGLPIPRTEVVNSLDDARAAATKLGYPCVLKPATKSAGWLAHSNAKGFLARDAEHLLSIYDTVADWSPVLLAQEWVPGPESELFSCNAYFAGAGDPLVTFVARKVRQWPPGIGTSASGEECRNDEVLATTLQLFGGVGFRGLAYLEMKRDARTGQMMIIEPNVGRPTGRSAIAEAGGVELLHTAFCDAAGLPLPRQREQTYTGARWIDIRRDAQAAVVARRHGTLTLLDWARWVRGPKAHAIWSRRDPAPFAVDLVRACSTGARTLASRLGDRRRPSSPSGPGTGRSGHAEPATSLD